MYMKNLTNCLSKFFCLVLLSGFNFNLISAADSSSAGAGVEAGTDERLAAIMGAAARAETAAGDCAGVAAGVRSSVAVVGRSETASTAAASRAGESARAAAASAIAARESAGI